MRWEIEWDKHILKIWKSPSYGNLLIYVDQDLLEFIWLQISFLNYENQCTMTQKNSFVFRNQEKWESKWKEVNTFDFKICNPAKFGFGSMNFLVQEV